MPTKTQSLKAGQVHKLPCNGYFFQLLESQAKVDISFCTSGMAQKEDNNGVEAGFWFKSLELMTFVEIKSEVDQEIIFVYSIGQTGYDRATTFLNDNTISALNDIRYALGDLTEYAVDDPVIVDLSNNKKLSGFYLKASAGNVETILLSNDDIAPSDVTKWPDDLKLVAGQSKFINFTGEPVYFTVPVGGVSSLVFVVPLYRV